MFGSRRDQDRAAGLRADVDSLQARLAADVSNLDPGNDPVCRQALVDASERASAAGALMSRARSAGEFDVAKRTVLEGLTATRLVRERLGLPLGPDLPPDGRTVDAATPVEVEGQQYTAHPEYHPARPHFFGGGLGAPGGYYRTPFWQKALAVGGAVAGVEMLGDLVGGGQGWGGDYDRGGYDRGEFDDGGDGGGGGDWG
jgi:hypothetical protein